MHLLKMRYLIILLFVVTIILFGLSLLRSPDGSYRTPVSPREQWNTSGVNHYRMTILTVALPIPPIALDLTIQDDQILEERILNCDENFENYSASNCDSIQRYHPELGRYTIAELFGIADDGIRTTLTSLEKCPLFQRRDFAWFTSVEAMMDAVQTCSDYLDGSDRLTAVEYDPDYGYPITITRYIPEVMDGFSSITIEQFQVIQ